MCFYDGRRDEPHLTYPRRAATSVERDFYANDELRDGIAATRPGREVQVKNTYAAPRRSVSSALYESVYAARCERRIDAKTPSCGHFLVDAIATSHEG
jgi:hypothetical protein